MAPYADEMIVERKILIRDDGGKFCKVLEDVGPVARNCNVQIASEKVNKLPTPML